MFIKTFGSGLWFVAGLGTILLIPSVSFAAAPDSPRPVPHIAVHIAVHNDAGVPLDTMTAAEQVAGEVFAQAGLSVSWIHCGRSNESESDARGCSYTSFPDHLQLRILSRPRNLPEYTFGLSYLGADGTGCYSEVFAARVGELSEKTHQSASAILGLVMAHELAHLLLGTNSHSSAGIMKARWEAAALQDATRGELRFTAREAAMLRSKVLAERLTTETPKGHTPAAD